MNDRQWQCSQCHTLVDKESTRKCPHCGNIIFYPLADAVYDNATGNISTEGFDIEKAIASLKNNGNEN
ncbi:MAG: hypothetical protein ABEI06_00415 [Halobacteriaceae archaeon]